MKHIKKFNEDNETQSNNVIEHYFLRQHMEVSGLSRKKGNGEEIIISSTGVIKNIRDFGDDIGYEVEFPISIEHRSPYGKRWKEDKASFTVFHNKNKDNIINVY